MTVYIVYDISDGPNPLRAYATLEAAQAYIERCVDDIVVDSDTAEDVAYWRATYEVRSMAIYTAQETPA